MVETLQTLLNDLSEQDDVSPDIALSLLKAVPFEWNVREHVFVWPDLDQITAFLKSPANLDLGNRGVPEVFNADAVMSLREDAIAALAWDGDRYIIYYELSGFDGQTLRVEERGERYTDAVTGDISVQGVLRDVTTEFEHDRSRFKTSSSFSCPHYSKDDILSLLSQNKLTLAYQSIVDANDKSVVHYECLMRLIGDDGRLSSAGFMIMDAEKLGLIDRIDMLALDLATETLATHIGARLALNVSAGTVKNAETAKAYLEKLTELGDDAKRITVELTETLALEDAGLASDFAAKAKALGCQFAVDDFGAGHTTFSNLLGVEADIIKIDGSFVRDVSTVREKQVFVRLIVDLARTLCIKTVAEMVDNETDARYLTELGIDYLQGYLFGYPGAIV